MDSIPVPIKHEKLEYLLREQEIGILNEPYGILNN